MRAKFVLMLFVLSSSANAQIFDTNSAQMVLDAQRSYVEAYGQMTQRAIQIMRAVQPLREAMYQQYSEGNYKDALEICQEAFNQYVYYVFDNKGIRDMETLAGDCAVKIGLPELAIFWYNLAKGAGDETANSKLLTVFNNKLEDARYSYRKNDISSLWEDVTIALKTGWENGECYYYYGVCYENGNNYKDAKSMYKLAKKKKYSPAETALKSLKNKQKRKKSTDTYY
jgi:tetratricopeptide (TPR) repeat protein